MRARTPRDYKKSLETLAWVRSHALPTSVISETYCECLASFVTYIPLHLFLNSFQEGSRIFQGVGRGLVQAIRHWFP